MSRNDLEGHVPVVGYMVKLKTLSINDNRFEGQVPETLTLLTNLENTVQVNEFGSMHIGFWNIFTR